MGKKIKWSSEHWTSRLTELFIEKAMLNEDEQYILKSRIAGYTISEQSRYLNISERSVSRIIKTLQDKYDIVQSEEPTRFPKSKANQCDAEIYMNEN